ncbi:MAG TPA: thioredoxin family protein [Stellaceae bacterium]|nr:thioredoxin family protein [Stellaceae bacterium]
MNGHVVASHAEWLAARKELLAKEKEFTRLRDELSRARRALPWERVEKPYAFDAPDGRKTLGDLFAGRSQLAVYHFMFDPEWSEGCKSCSFWADNFNPNVVHLAQRDVSMVSVSRAPLPQIEAFKRRMGWSFPWVSSAPSDFNRDYHVSFTKAEAESGEAEYNYRRQRFSGTERPGFSIFFRDSAGAVFHTYSCYARGLDMMNAGYQILDLVPKGRDEEGLPYPQAWVRWHDRYAG